MASIAFFPSLYGKAVPGLCFLSLSLISVKRRIYYPVMMEQIDKAPTNNPPDVSKKKSPGKRGRPQGSKNRRRRAVELSPALRFVQETITRFLQLIGDHVITSRSSILSMMGHLATMMPCKWSNKPVCI